MDVSDVVTNQIRWTYLCENGHQLSSTDPLLDRCTAHVWLDGRTPSFSPDAFYVCGAEFTDESPWCYYHDVAPHLITRAPAEVSEGLIEALNELADSYGALGVALVAAQLTDRTAFLRRFAEEEIDVVEAAIEWRDALVPSTSTSAWAPTKDLVTALRWLECEHPRSERVYFPSVSSDEQCGRCGKTLTSVLSRPRTEQAPDDVPGEGET